MFGDGSYQLPPPIKQDEKFLSKLLSRESSLANPSHRVYYGVSSSVPFVWESQPGTPKHKFSETTLPPLTPPPSYYSNLSNKPMANKRSRTNLLRGLLSKINLKKPFLPFSTSLQSSSSPWASSSDSRIVPMATLGRNHRQRRQCSISSSSSFDFTCDIDDEQRTMSLRTSTLCFGIRRSSGTRHACTCRTW